MATRPVPGHDRPAAVVAVVHHHNIVLTPAPRPDRRSDGFQGAIGTLKRGTNSNVIPHRPHRPRPTGHLRAHEAGRVPQHPPGGASAVALTVHFPARLL